MGVRGGVVRVSFSSLLFFFPLPVGRPNVKRLSMSLPFGLVIELAAKKQQLDGVNVVFPVQL